LKAKTFNWNIEKNSVLRKSRSISFKGIVNTLNDDRLLDIIPSPTHDDQLCFAIEVEDYVYIVPFVEEDEHTIF
jgi:hypothetical protein